MRRARKDQKYRRDKLRPADEFIVETRVVERDEIRADGIFGRQHGERLMQDLRYTRGNEANGEDQPDKDGKELMNFPLTVGVVGALFAPVLAAIGALAALIGECTITVEREDTDENANL